MKRFIALSLFLLVMLGPLVSYGENNQCPNLQVEMEELKLEKKELEKKIEKLEKPDVNYQRYTKRNVYLRASNKRSNKIPVLMYHHILPQADMHAYGHNNNNAILSLEDFEKQMKYLRDNNFYTASLEEVELFLDGKIFLPEKTVVITFDDGYLSNTHHAYPILKKYGQNASVFLIGNIVEKDHTEKFNPKIIQFMSKDNLDKYRDVLEFQSHTYGMHRSEAGKTALMTSTMDELNKDFKKMQEIYNCKYIAYPHGGYSEDIIKAAKANDYKLGFTIEQGYLNNETNRFKIPRFEVSKQSMPFNRFKKIVNN